MVRAADEIDAIAAYSPELHRCLLIPISEASGRSAFYLRLDQTGNNQAHGIKWARDYDFASGIDRLRLSTMRDTRSLDSYTFRA